MEKGEEINKNNNYFQYKWRYLIPFGIVLLIALMANGMQYLGMSTNYRAFFSKENPQLQAFENMQNIYNKDDNVLMMLEPKDGKVFSQKTLAAVIDLTKQSWQVPYSTRVDSISNFQHTKGEEDDLLVNDLVENPENLNPQQLQEIKKIALNEPLLIHRLISPKADVTAVNVTLELPGKKLTEVPEAVAFVREMADDFRKKYPDIDLYLTGMAVMNNSFPEASMRDMQSLNPLMLLMIIIFTFFMTRSILGTVITFFIMIGSILSAMGIGGYAGVELTPVSMTAVSVIMTLAVADCIHVIITFREWMAKGLDRVQAVKKSLQVNLLPVFITSLTTSIGFLGLNFSDAPPYHHYGNISAAGVMIAFFFSVTLLPAILIIIPSKVKMREKGKNTIMQNLAEWLLANKWVAAASTLAITLFLTLQIPKIELNDEFVKYFGKEISFRRHTDHIAEKLTGTYNMSYSLKTELEGGVSNPTYLKKLEEFSAWLATLDGVNHVNTLSDIFKRLNKNMHNDDPNWYKIPDNKELSAQYLLLYEMSLPYGLDLTNTINLSKDASKLTITLENRSTQYFRALETKTNRWIQENAQGVFTGLATSPVVMFSHISERNINSMISGTFLSVALITIVIMIALKSFRFGLLSLIPNVIPILLAFGTWSVLVGQIGMAVATIASLTMGIVVDDSVHFLSKYLRARKEEGLDPEKAIIYAFSTVGYALMATSVILVAGFLVMSQSSFRMNWSMGMLSAITIAFALIADFLLLPALLLVYERLRGYRPKNDDDVATEAPLMTQS